MLSTLSVFFALSLLIFPLNGNAYIDAGTGSFVLQMLFASLVGGLFTVKLYFQKIKNFFTGTKNPEKVDNDNNIEDVKR